MKQRILAVPAAARLKTISLTSFTRQGAVAAARRVSTSRVMSPARQMVMMLAGSSLIGFGVAAFRAGDLGLPPWDVLLSSIDRASPLSHGQAAWVGAGVLLIIASLLGQRPRPTTLLYIFTTGLVVDGFSHLLVSPDNPALRVGLMATGVGAIAWGIAVVVHSGLTGGPFELLMRAGEQRGLPATPVRLGLEATVLTVGIVAGGDFGLGTIVFALSIGKVLSVLLQAMADHRRGRELRLG
ncbi:MAG: YczE/YyaS/YitT family protein [Acidimicrobiales bacterium]